MDIGVKTRMKILVADDEQNIATLIQDWLSDLYDVSVAFNGFATLQKAKWEMPQLILLDIVMPDMSGYDVARALRADPDLAGIPLIGMTAKSYDDSTIKMVKAEPNVRGFINKPFRPGDLKRLIESVLAAASQAAAQPPPAVLNMPAASSPAVVEAPVGMPIPVVGAPTSPAPAPVSVVKPPPPYAWPAPLATPAPMEPPPAPPVSAPAAAPLPSPALPPLPEVATPVKPPARKPASSPFASIETEAKSLWDDLAMPLIKWGFLGSGVLLWSLLLVLLSGEVVARLASRFFEETVIPPLVVSRHATLPFQIRPSSSFSRGGISYEFNEWGLRGPALPLLAGATERRIFVLGGNGVFGEGMSWNQSVVGQLEKIFNEQPLKQGPKVRVINGGLWSYSPQQQWDYFEKEAAQLRPDILVWLCESPPPQGPRPHRLKALAEGRWWFPWLPQVSRLGSLSQEAWLRREAPEPSPPLEGLMQTAQTFIAGTKTAFLFVEFPDRSMSTPRSNFCIRLKEGDPCLNPKDLTEGVTPWVARWLFDRIMALPPMSK